MKSAWKNVTDEENEEGKEKAENYIQNGHYIAV